MKPELEPLECRLLLSSAVIKDKALIVRGDLASRNTITVSLDATKKLLLLELNGSMAIFKKSRVDRVQLLAGNLADTLRVDESVVKFTLPVLFLGGTGDDTLIGGSEADKFFAGNGNDSIMTGDGDDTVVGGNGGDIIIAGNDFKLIFGGTGNDTITTGAGRGYIFGGGGNDSITTEGNRYEIIGGQGNDTITGHGRDTLWGGGGNDLLTGGAERHRSQVRGISKILRLLLPIPPTVDSTPA